MYVFSAHEEGTASSTNEAVCAYNFKSVSVSQTLWHAICAAVSLSCPLPHNPLLHQVLVCPCTVYIGTVAVCVKGMGFVHLS